MFTDSGSLRTIIGDRAKDGSTEVVYVASHGNKTKIGPNATSAVSRTELRNSFAQLNAAGTLKGLYLGTCQTGNADTAAFFLEEPKTNLVWVAGYSASVDWIEGSAIDMIFMSKLSELYKANSKKKKGKLSPRRMAHQAASALIALIPGAHSQYGFNIFFKENNQLTSMFA